ncbi:unnamed protein product, partial [Larinioides sclopetarius]
TKSEERNIYLQFLFIVSSYSWNLKKICHFASIDKNGMKMSFRSQTLVLINAK